MAGFFTIDEAAKYLGTSRRNVLRFIKDQKDPLPHYRLNRKIIRLKPDEIDGWMRKFKVQSPAVPDADRIVRELLAEAEEDY